MDINEENMITLLKQSKNVLLVEPPYCRSYIPLGLAKISTFIKNNGGQTKYCRNPIDFQKYDLICITTLFTTDSKIVINTIKEIQKSIFYNNIPILVGGIFASLMPEILNKIPNIFVFINYSKRLDNCLPDYSLDYKIDGFFKDAMTLFTTRGCPNKCSYCMVWRMETEFYINLKWKDNLEKINKKICVISDNNFLAAPQNHIKNVISVLNKTKKKVIFNNGIDCRLIDEKNAKLLSTLHYIKSGFRTAFDRMTDDGYYQKAMELMNKKMKLKGNSYTYVLFNYMDTPQEAYYRVKECWKYGSNPYLMQYRPLNQLSKNNSYIGKYWTKNLVKAFKDWGINFGYNRYGGFFENWKNKVELTKEDWDKWNFKK